MSWNFHMDEAPKGETVERKTTLKDGTVRTSNVYQTVKIIAADGGSDVVTLSNWMPDDKGGRWNMFTREKPPVAWMAWPEHPGAKP